MKSLLPRSRVMGVVNVTPDSFSDGGRFLLPEDAIAHALRLVADGADIIDVGGESTRPGSAAVSVEEELSRVLPVIQGIRARSSIPISIDTTKTTVAAAAIGQGATMINDISAGRFDPEMLPLAHSRRVPICLMHMRGTPQTMQQDVRYDDLIGDLCDFFDDAINRALKIGLSRDMLIIDPGIGFGKSPEGNITILRELARLAHFCRPILIGTSRKSFMGKLLGHGLEDRLEATLATLSLARRNGASIFRVHDVAAARRYLDMVDLLEPIAKE